MGQNNDRISTVRLMHTYTSLRARAHTHTHTHKHTHTHFLLNGAATKIYHIHLVEHRGWSLNKTLNFFALYLMSQHNLLYLMLLVHFLVQ
jgi:hypothetical protein